MQLTWHQLHQLIHRMHRNEKGYFRKQQEGFGGRADALYVRLFNLLEQHSEVDTDSIKKQLGPKANPTAVRNHLARQITKSLRNYHLDNEPQMQLREMMDQVDILEKRGLAEAAITLTNQALEIAEKNNWLPYEILLLNRKRALINLLPEAERATTAAELYQKTLQAGNTFDINTRVSYTHGRIAAYVNTHYPLRDAAIKSEVNALIEEMHLMLQREGISPVAVSTIHGTLALAHRLKADFNTAIHHQRESMKAFDTPDMIKTKTRQYYAAWYNLIALYTLNGNFDEAFPLTRQLLTLPTFAQGDAQFVEAIYCHQLLACRLGNKSTLTPDEQATIQTFIQTPPLLKGVYEEALYKYACILFTSGDVTACLNIIGKLRDEFATHTLISLHIHIRLLEVLAHYTLQHHQLLPSLIRSTYRLMLKKALTFRFEHELLLLFKKLVFAADVHDRNTLMQHTLQSFQHTAADPYEKAAMLNYFDYAQWMRNSINAKY